MPATEKTWRDQARMHVIFGVSSLVMLVGTIWMLSQDHNREWRRWQLDDRSRERWTTEAQLAQAEAETASKRDELHSQLTAAQRAKVDAEPVQRFKQRVQAEDGRLEKRVDDSQFAELNQALTNLENAEDNSPAAADARQALIDALNDFIHEARRRENGLLTEKKFLAADQTAAVSARGIAIGEGRPTKAIEEKIQGLVDQILVKDAALAEAKDYRMDLEAIVKEIQADGADLEKQLAAIDTELNRLREQSNQDVNAFWRLMRVAGEKVNRLPVLDALYTGDIKLDQIWLPDMKINYNFSYVARYDRCIVCHRVIDKTAPGSATDPAYPAIPRNERERIVQLTTPEKTVAELYGMALGAPDANNAAGATVQEVVEGGLAGHATLESGDVLLEIDQVPVPSLDEVDRLLLDTTTWDAARELKVRRAKDGTEQQIELPSPTIKYIYGLVVTPHGQVNPNDVTVQVVVPHSRAALAGLQMGDVLLEVNGGPVKSLSNADHYLLEEAEWGKPLGLKIKRGLEQPFTSHPRLDLFVGSTSPHKKGQMGCTICHDGQGSATDFKWASHTPNDPQQALNWSRTHGWFDNHHWIFPMTPERFIESNCLKCHHEVVDLEPSERFPEPPAPKLVEGYHLVRQFGCYGCHEINGYETPTKRLGPDMRIEPNYYEVASQIAIDPGLNDAEKALARDVAERPDEREARRNLYEAIRADAALASAASASGPSAPGSAGRSEAAETGGEPQQPRLTAATHALADALKDADMPGQFRRVGPSLRHLNSKVDYNWLYSWIRRPADFRPSTRMPQFFLHYEHLNAKDEEFPIRDVEGKETKVTDRQYTERFENIEIRALAEFLLANSQPYEYMGPPQGLTEGPDATRGKWLFESRGCLACHSHAEFPGIESNQGPDLSRIAAKFNTEKGQRWLYSWLKDPRSYHVRTAMPNLFLNPITELDETGSPTGRVSDPAADIMAFLLGVPAGWQPEAQVPPRELSADEQAALNDLTTVWLSASFPHRRAERFATDGIPARLAATVKVDEKILVGMTPENRTQRQLEYVARRSLSRYGCFGCHDIPGYETAKAIGTPLANWGRKDPAQLAFENIGQFLATHGIDGTGRHASHGETLGERESAGVGLENETANEAGAEQAEEAHAAHGLDPLSDEFDLDTAYFLQSLNSHQRNGFLWQKLRMPRSFDYEATRTKRYDERLRMPKFPFDAAQREAVMTFILGLTAEAPAERYIYKPDERQDAIVQGRHVLDKYNCAGCHILDMERWDIAFEPAQFEEPPATTDYPFVVPPVTPEQVAASLKPDRGGLLHAELHGMPMRNEETGAARLVDIDGVPIEPDDTESEPFYEFQLYEHAVVKGALRMVGVQNLVIPAKKNGNGPLRGTAYPGHGGDLAKYLYPHVIADEKTRNPQVVASEAWGWLPPPLHHEGDKVQTDWLHDFLMDPTSIRPAVVMRMPNFHMSPSEAAKLVNYFAAKSDAEFPYEYNNRRRGSYLAQLEQSHPALLNDAMKIVTDGNYCVKCHSIGDYQVRGAVKTLGPDLHEVYRRMRPEYVKHWVANPQRILPYTGMPVNIPYDPTPPNYGGVNQALFPGPSFVQLDGLVDLLMNFDEYAKRHTSVKGLVREPAAPAGAPPAASDRPPDNRSASR